ncbi:4-carboxy-4-hydroxy-2-oxoadipate aldolase/oxaloacetate decarboxylase [Alicyclobacillus dauci]|uniref:Putative 4-hydroxy-4-methyl-2-oxoglutarate aldolase n=1 Tax=Alicyclobacillus dauci TaxID=1475485 RepID=A0ABY6Z5S6_9BACL|nr:4-carboxy-4-hydroxy-2-oxoadipate aldolase/oxaloacetate decarboxylase [Alicyclobacillus dauci]WAH37634.1 4-carboxy-4-hydroxy-2-oxoadipate aldolase/oxaloacetate decarboxylase [Alicyclobacillus dauci]
MNNTLHDTTAVQVNSHLIEEVRAFSAATLHEASGQYGALPSEIKPISSGMSICGKATTVLSPPNDNLWLHRALYEAEPGDVLVVDVGLEFEAGYWGDIMTHAALERGLGGLVINGCVRDLAQIETLNFPIFARGICIHGTGKDHNAAGAINVPVRLGNAIIFPGDMIVGDRDGVVSIARSRIADVVQRAKEREEKENRILQQLEQGHSTLELYGW